MPKRAQRKRMPPPRRRSPGPTKTDAVEAGLAAITSTAEASVRVMALVTEGLGDGRIVVNDPALLAALQEAIDEAQRVMSGGVQALTEGRDATPGTPAAMPEVPAQQQTEGAGPS